jgi:hypothetical protein
MAGFGFSPQDIAQGISLAKRIFEAHFVRELRAGTSKSFLPFEWQTFEAPRTGLAGNGRKRDLGGLTPPATHAPQLVQDILTPFSPKMVDTSSSVSKSEA